MRGYPPGTKCIVTWATEVCAENGMYIGRIVTVGPGFIPSPFGCPAQETDVPYPGTRALMCHPVDWLRRLEDPDAEDRRIEKGEELPA